MMISPEAYIEELKNATYTELINERKGLIEYIATYETNEISGDRTSEEWQVCPLPDVKYQCYLEYLAILCTFMRRKYNEEYVWGGKKLSDDQ
jgi:hypothetical protein